MPVRSPLTAAARQCSRRPARHVVVRSQFSPTAFLWFDEPLVFVNETALVPKTPLRPTEGAFLRVRAAKTAPDGRPKRVLNEPQECQPLRMGRPNASLNRMDRPRQQ